MHTCQFDDLSAVERDLINQAQKVLEFSYSDYSKFRVGAAIMCEDGSVYLGTNMENASYSLTICAESAALAAAVSAGKRRFKAIAVVAITGKEELEAFSGPDVVTPCGACRQRLVEFVSNDSDTRVLCTGPKSDDVIVTSVKELMPGAFSLSAT